MNEIWKDIDGFQGCYQVSNLGRIKSIDRVCLKQRKTTHGYKWSFINENTKVGDFIDEY